MTNETAASQPKSIGDDAQFSSKLWQWHRSLIPGGAVAQAATESLIAYIDSKLRAPAAQAFATIQAAPDDLPSTMEDARKLIQYLRIENDSKVMELYDIKKKLAATIQEPVMVAERTPNSSDPRDEAHAAGWNACLAAIRLAAPMVADPAGVVCGTCDAIGSHRHGCPLAATVKAVPSEALELAGMVVKATFGDHKILVPRVDLSGKGIGTLVYFAAPLADKTGGGE